MADDVATTQSGGGSMERIIKAAVDRGASDLHIKAGDVFRARIDGKLVPLTKQALSPEQTRSIALKLIANDDDRARIDKIQDYDCSWGAKGIGRFRVNILRQRSSFMIVMRVIPFEVPNFEKLRLPPVMNTIADTERGMVLVTGVTGSGKSSTMAALINQINATKHKHIVTLENPLEFLHRDIQCSITQREIGVDTESFQMGLRAALRQDPDVILVGEMRDLETIETALTAAETGHLVMSTLHTLDAMETVNRIISVFPPYHQRQIRTQLSGIIKGVVSQRLVPKADGKGRVPAVEIMIGTARIRECIDDPAKTKQLNEAISQGVVSYGMQTFDQSLMQLHSRKLITYEEALRQCSNPDDFALKLSGISSTSDLSWDQFLSDKPENGDDEPIER